MRRRYPSCCTSAYCDKCGEQCEGCPFKPVLDEFKAWRERTGAVCVDPIWSPSFYEVPE